MKVDSVAECSYFWPALTNNWPWKPIFSLFESGGFTQVLLYLNNIILIQDIRTSFSSYSEWDPYKLLWKFLPSFNILFKFNGG